MTFTEIKSDARETVSANSISYTDASIASSANRALERAISLIRKAQARWQWDDSNQSDLPSSTTTLNADTHDYSLDPTHLKIEGVAVKDTTGLWIKLLPIDYRDISIDINEFMKTSSTPRYYDKKGNSIFLYPAPNYTQSASLRVYYERGPSYFTSSDTTKEPGFNPLYHRLISRWCALDFAVNNSMPIAKDLAELIRELENDLMEEYNTRDKDEQLKIKPRINNSR